MDTDADLPETDTQRVVGDLAKWVLGNDLPVTPRNDYAVGAVVETESGDIYPGANVELPAEAGEVSAPDVAAALLDSDAVADTDLDVDPEVARTAAEIAPVEATNLHAEVLALAGALADGHDEIRRVGVATEQLDGRVPCETCQPLLRDHAGPDGIEVVTPMGLVLSRRFDLDDLGPWVEDLEFLSSTEMMEASIESTLERDGDPVDARLPNGDLTSIGEVIESIDGDNDSGLAAMLEGRVGTDDLDRSGKSPDGVGQ